MKTIEDKVRVDLVKGVEGISLYINDTRVLGSKPWGGGTIVKTWIVDRSRAETDFANAIKGSYFEVGDE